MNKVKVLFLAANPRGTQPLQLDEEIRQITAKVRAAEYRDSLELISRWAVRPDDLLQALLEVKPHIVHFSGHGSPDSELIPRGSQGSPSRDFVLESAPPDSELILLDDRGNPKPVSEEALVHLFRTLKDNVRVVVLNACYSRPQATALAKTIDCTIGMSRPIGDEAAIVFAASFYRAVGFGRSVRDAFDLGGAALLLEGIPEHNSPQLHVRDGVDAAALILVDQRAGPVAKLVPPQPVPAASPTSPLPAMNRLTFVRTLGALSPPDFDMLVTAIPNAAQQVSRQGATAERAAELFRWAESPTGSGLRAIEVALRDVLGRP
jgi:hypothetical protein